MARGSREKSSRQAVPLVTGRPDFAAVVQPTTMTMAKRRFIFLGKGVEIAVAVAENQHNHRLRLRHLSIEPETTSSALFATECPGRICPTAPIRLSIGNRHKIYRNDKNKPTNMAVMSLTPTIIVNPGIVAIACAAKSEKVLRQLHPDYGHRAVAGQFNHRNIADQTRSLARSMHRVGRRAKNYGAPFRLD
ncbi:hypothetical protein LZ012_14325 [Dechloromonas sp. XY25]|uniref:Uncharacterized protein n=1 Tax=Dechloromonas hankyongensis TaxID=2908002 RepID=A0ABS9K4U2_9RHOO|nr:hypothetical protein [Dechloromonas hankyongensis]MCG2578168.1 hypothetical protein [Dechloromonas hankyongensis]